MDQKDICQGIKQDLRKKDAGHDDQTGKTELADQGSGKKTGRKSQPAAEQGQKKIAFPEISGHGREQPEQQTVFCHVLQKVIPGKAPGGDLPQTVFCLISQPEDSVRTPEVRKQNTEKEQGQKQGKVKIPPAVFRPFYFV